MNIKIFFLIFICSVCSIESTLNLNQTLYVYRYDGSQHSKEPIELGKISSFGEHIQEYFIIDGTKLQNETFALNRITGKLTILHNASTVSTHFVKVQMKAEKYETKYVQTDLKLHIIIMSSEKIEQSGSFRIKGITAENFMTSDSENNLRDQVSTYLNEKIEMHKSCVRKIEASLTIEIFSIVPNIDDKNTLDLRFTATAYDTKLNETLNFVDQIYFFLLKNQKDIQEKFNFEIVEVNINKCKSEKNECKSSCHNKITEIKPSNAIVTTHHLFHGLDITVEPVCECRRNLDLFNNVMNKIPEININNYCPTFFPNIEPCENLSINLEFTPKSDTRIILKFDSKNYNLTRDLNDFLLLELVNFKPQLIVDFGSGQTIIKSSCNVTLMKPNTINIIIQQQKIELIIRNTNSSSCRTIRNINGNSKVLNLDTSIFFGDKHPSKFNDFEFKNNPNDSQNRLLYGVITSLYINNFVTDDTVQYKFNGELTTIMMCIIGILSFILTVLLIVNIKKKLSAIPNQYFVRLRGNNLNRPPQKRTNVELNQSYSTPNNIYSDDSNFYTDIQYASRLEVGTDNNENYEIKEQNELYSLKNDVTSSTT